MIAKLVKGKGFRGALNYALNKNGASVIGGNMVTTTPRGIAREFKAFRELKPKLKRAVAHVSLSAAKTDVLSDEQWSEIAELYMQKMGYGDAPYTLIKHADTEHEHVHIIASRIKADGSVVSESNDYKRQEKVMREVERIYGLQHVPDSNNPDNDKPLTKNEVEQAARTDEMPARTQLQTLVAAAAGATSNYTDFALALDIAGVRHEVQLQKQGEKWNGVKFSLDGQVWFKGSDLGKKFTAYTLQINGVEYEQSRDFEAADSRRINRENFEKDASAVGRSSGLSRPEPNKQQSSARPASSNQKNKADNSPNAGAERPSERAAERNRPAMVSSSPATGGDNRDDFNISVNALAVAASSGKNKSKALIAKEKAWQQQHQALQSPRYRLTLKSRREGQPSFNLGKNKDAAETFYSYEQVLDKLSYLSKKNAEGYDIYLTPISEDKRYLLVDDITPEKEIALINNGYIPALIQQSSENNRQAVLVCARDPDDDKHANTALAGINKKYGDPALSGAIHPFRLAGFANKKEGRNSAFTRIVKAVHGLCSKAYRLIQQVKENAEREREKAKIDRANAVKATDGQLEKMDFSVKTDDPVIAFLQAKQNILLLVERKGWPYDESRADFMAAQTLFKQGYSFGQVVSGLLECPNIGRKSDPVIYAERTSLAAQNSLPSIKAKTSENTNNAGFEQSENQPSYVKKVDKDGPVM